MDEKPKSIWKKSWTGWRGLLLWFILLIIIAFAVFLCVCMASSKTNPIGTSVVFALSCALVGILIIAFIRWIFCWRNFKRFLFGLACFATLIALFYAEEDWRGKHDWNKFKREWEAKGERFDWQSIVPPPVPDDQNFALTPIVASSYAAWLDKNGHRVKPYDTNVVNRLQMNIAHNDDWPKTNGISDWQKATVSDLKVWQNYYRALAATTNEFPIASQPQTPAQDVLLALSKYDSTIEELRQDSARPDSRFPLGYDAQPPAGILLPHLAALKRCSRVLQLRAIAELQNNESQKALDDVKLSLRLIDSIRTEPFLISHLVRLAILQITLQPVYEGLANHQWSDAQLVELDSELAKLNFLADFELTMRGERTVEIANIEFLRHPPHNPDFNRPRFYFLAPFFSLVQMLSNFSSEGSENPRGFQMLALGLGPSGWLDQNEMRIAQFETKWYLPIVDEDTETISPAKARAGGNALDREMRHRTPENVFETLFIPGLGSAAQKFARAQSSVDLARVAIALERFHLARGEFPGSLDAIASQFPEGIPHDIINGEPLHYRKTLDGQFVLYSVGWNERDDGGVVVFGKGKTPSVDTSRGDWVWRYPQK
jgi:hypothetical protein